MVLKCFNFFNNIIDGDFLVFEGEADNELEDAESNWLFFVLGFPVETFLRDLTEDFLSEVIEVGLTVQWLDLQQHE